MAGLVTAFVFAVQMINFPILPGASGHLLGGALVAILVGPVGRRALHRDRARGAGPAVRRRRAHRARHQHHQHGADRRVRRLRRSPSRCAALARRSRAGLVATAFVAALVNTVVASLGFVLEYAIGGAGGASLGTVFALMVGLHVLIGIGEGIITAATVGAVAAVRPDLVYLLRGQPRRCAAGRPRRRRERVMSTPAPQPSHRRFFVGFLVVALLIAGGLSYFASSDPDGLDTRHPRAAARSSRPTAASSSTAPASRRTPATTRTAGSPLADYSGRRRRRHRRARPASSACWSPLVVAGGLFWLLRRRGDPTRPEATGRWAPDTHIRSTCPGNSPVHRLPGRGQDRRGVPRRGLRGGHAARGVRGVRRLPAAAGRGLGGRPDPAGLDRAPVR